MRKRVCWIMALLLCLGSLAGCAGDSTENTQPPVQTGALDQTGTSQTDGTSEETTNAFPEDTTQDIPADTEADAPVLTDPEETTQPSAGFSLNREDITLVTTGETWKLYNGSVDPQTVVWGSQDETVATFEDGVVTAVGKGTTEVYAEYNGQRYSCIIRCNLNDAIFGTSPAGTEGEATPEPTEAPAVPSGGSRDPVKQPPSTQTVDASFFDDAVFIGDSISLKLSYYAASSGELGKAKFLVMGSYGVGNAVGDVLQLTYQGTPYTNVEDALAATGAKKLFIMLGMNDIGLYGIDGTIDNWGKLLGLIRTTCPDMKIYIQSMTPVWTGGEKGGLRNPNVDSYNEKLKSFAASNGCTFIDVAPYMKDSTGGLATVYCSDNYVHLSTMGAQTWVKVLRAFAGY